MKLLLENDPFLKQPSLDIDIKNLPDGFDKNIIDMTSIMLENGANSISANEVGLPWRVFVINTIHGLTTFINPKILKESSVLSNKETCISFPNLSLVVNRPNIIDVCYYDDRLQYVVSTLYGIDATCFLHELDHLNGITFDERVSKFQLKKSLKKRKTRTGN